MNLAASEIIARTELAIIDRLKRGLGKMAHDVSSYGGELDGDWQEVVRQLPGVWVTFEGVTRTERFSLQKRRYVVHGRYVVIVGERNLRDEKSSRLGGPGADETGTTRLVTAVRRLLSGQDMDLPIDHLIPGRVRTLFNTKLEKMAASVFACEFDTKWLEDALENGDYPLRDAPADHPDAFFMPYDGEVSDPPPDWLRTRLSYDTSKSASSAEDIVSHESKD
ncbi:DUF1834 family protein [Erwinia psidii]|uniref:DUF1834 family protein n=1 Tax=Erwinia psidii TaxID=69224 RepID=UPI00226B524A|nr:DUF1834 family protein [Erwinia psidii]MCX8962138.1 DUF1834 family protein [Erwinia psidii]